MKVIVVCFLLLLTNLGLTQINMEPNGPLVTKIKTDADKVRIGISTQLAHIPIKITRLNVSIDLFHKNKRFGIGPNFFLNENISNDDLQVDNYGYVATFNYIFPQNRNVAKAFIPLEFEHHIKYVQRFDYYDHIVQSSGPGNFENPGYSFNLNSKVDSNTFNLMSGLGVYIWFHDHFYLIGKGLVGAIFSGSKTEYVDLDSNTSIGVEYAKLTLNKSRVVVSFNLGVGFRL